MRIESGSARLHCEVLGEQSDTPVLLLHGLGGSRLAWSGITAAFAHTRRVIAADLRGCGLSERGNEPYDFALLGSDVVTILDAVGAQRAHIVGHSLGGVIAQEVLTQYGERTASAVLISTSARVGASAAAAWQALADLVEVRGLTSVAATTERAFTREFAERHADTVALLSRITSEADPHVYAAQARIASAYDYTNALIAVSQPVLILQGLGDRLTSPGGSVLLSRAISGARLEMIEGVGHNLHLEMGDDFVKRVERFFSESEAAASRP